MLYSILLELSARQAVALPVAMGHLVHALFLNLVKQFDPVLSARMHDEASYRPYTVSPLDGGMLMGKRILLKREQICSLRITLLDGGALWQALQTHFLEAGPIYVRLGEADFLLTRIRSTSTADSTDRVSATAWSALLALPAQRTIVMHFCTATAFSLGGHQFCLFPEPNYLFESLLRDWNRYAPEDARMETNALRESIGKHIAVTACSLRHTFLHFPRYVQKGFIGRCTYYLSTEQQQLAHLLALAAFARYAGVGYKTTMGMGQVQVEFDERLSNSTGLLST